MARKSWIFFINPISSPMVMSANDMALFFSLHLLIWSKFVPLKAKLIKTKVSNLSPIPIRVNLVIISVFNIIFWSLVKRHSCFNYNSVSSNPYILMVNLKIGCRSLISVWYCSKVHYRNFPVTLSVLILRSQGFKSLVLFPWYVWVSSKSSNFHGSYLIVLGGFLLSPRLV